MIRNLVPTGRRLALAATLALVSAVSGCAGYTNDPLFPAGARNICVPVFENDTFFRAIEFDLTRSVCEVLRQRPGIHVTSQETADIILVGRITNLDQKVLSLGHSESVKESSATTEVECEVVDARTGKKLKKFKSRESVPFVLASGEGLQTAQQATYYDLARKIVEELEADW